MMRNKSTIVAAIAISMTILLASVQGSGLAQAIMGDANINSYGTITYPAPSTSKLMGVSHYLWGEVNASHFDLLSNCRSNVWREAFWFDSWNESTPYWRDPTITFRSKMLQMREWSHERGIKFFISPDTINYEDEDNSAQAKGDVIMNTSGKGDLWISCYGQVIRELQPDIIDVMNEPPHVSFTSYADTVTQEQFFQNYLNFVNKAVAAWTAIKPDIIFDVMGCPFWDLNPMMVKPINSSNVIYSLHYYYCLENIAPSSYDTAANRAYWAGTNLTQAKLLLENYLLNGAGIKSVLDKGYRVDMTEAGSCPEARNSFVFMQDMYDLCKKHGVGVLHFSLNPYPTASTGILNADWNTLNAMGQLWARNMAAG
ncbi:MAG: hypothetical protein ACE14S_05425 [Candidatus Bathyarchaeia archaeon]